MEPVPAAKTRMQLFEEKLRELVGEDITDEDVDKVHKASRKMFIDAVLKHMQLIFDSKSQTVQLNALKLYYDITGMTGDKRVKKPAEKPKAETVINCYMTQPVNQTADEHFTQMIREDALLDRKKQLPQ